MKSIKDIIRMRLGLGDTGPVPTHLPQIRRRFRVEIINENTLERSWSLRLSGIRVVVAAVVVLAAIASLITMIFMFTPVGTLLPGQLKGD